MPGITYGSAKYTTNAYFPGGNITFTCDLGYVLKGQETIKCQSSGAWDHRAPVCMGEFVYLFFMALGTAIATPPIFCQPKKFKGLKITTYKSVYSNKSKIGSQLSGYWKSQIYLSTKLYPFEMCDVLIPNKICAALFV